MAFETAGVGPDNAQNRSTPDQPQKVYSREEQWSDQFALDVCRKDFEDAEQYRSLNHDWRWRNADELYLAWMTQKYWEATRIPRSSLGIYVTLSQAESLLPRWLSTVFSDSPGWFQVEPKPSTSADQARAVRELLIYQLDADHTRAHERVREVFRRAFKSAIIYGNGIVEVGWRNQTVKRRRMLRKAIPKKATMDLGYLGRVSVPTGQFTTRFEEKEYTETLDYPFLRYISVKDFYIDPHTPSPIVQEARYAFKRDYVTIEALEELRDVPGFAIPSTERLKEMAIHKPYAIADWTKASTEIIRTAYYQPAVEYTAEPSKKRIEVIIRWDADHLVWMLNREYISYNRENPYTFIPFFNCSYVDVLDRFYGLAITDILEGEQRLIQSIINARVDELALSIHRPMIKRRGLSIPQHQLRRRPGQLIEAEDPRADIIVEEPKNVTQEAYVEVAAAERRAQQYTGITDLATLGTPSAGGNSATRTATGVNVQSQATFSRVQYIIENAEDEFIEPILASVHTLNQRFLDPNTITPIMGQDGQLIQIDHTSIINAEVKFAMRASAKMMSRQNILQIYPLVIQTFLNPAFMQMLAQQQKMTPNVVELAKMLLDAIGAKGYKDIFRPLTQEEMQASQQPPPEAQLKMAMQREKLQAHGEDQDAQAHADLLKTLIQQAPSLLGSGTGEGE